MTKRTKLTFISVVVAMIISVAIFAAVRHNYSDSRSMGGEGMLLLLPLITYVTCKNITTSLDVFQKEKKENLDEYESQILSSPQKLSNSEPTLRLIVTNQSKPVAEDHTT